VVCCGATHAEHVVRCGAVRCIGVLDVGAVFCVVFDVSAVFFAWMQCGVVWCGVVRWWRRRGAWLC
jgi:hypothetical protein